MKKLSPAKECVLLLSCLWLVTPVGLALAMASAAEQRPIPFRAIIASYSHPLHKAGQGGSDFWNRDQWAERLSLWSAQGYNAVVWLGSNEFGAVGDGADHLILRLNEFPEARQISPEENERIITQMKWLFRKAKDLGMKNFLYTQSVWYTLAFAKAHGLDKPMPVSPTVCKFHNEPYGGRLMPNCCVRNELTRAYTEAVFAEAPQLYEDLDGFYSPLGEGVPGDRGTWFKEAIAPGLRRSGRKPLMIVHQWQVPLETYIKNVAPKEVYDNTWLGYHAYNSEQITDAKPYPGLVDWAERTGLTTVTAVYPANITQFPFNSPQFAYEITHEMRKTENLAGFVAWQFQSTELSGLFYEALGYYGRNDEPYSDSLWQQELEKKYGNADAAQHFLNAYNISSRIIPEMCALVYLGNDGPRRELRLPYAFLTGQRPSSWLTSPARGEHLVSVPEYAYFVAKQPKHFKDNNGSDPTRSPFFQETIWGSEGGSIFGVIPPVQMAKISKMGEDSLREAELGLQQVKSNQEEAKHLRDYMQAYRLLSRYYEEKLAAAVAANIYAISRNPEDQKNALRLADAAVDSYGAAAQFMHDTLDPVVARLYGAPLMEGGKQTLPELLAAEKKERNDLPNIFHWPQ